MFSQSGSIYYNGSRRGPPSLLGSPVRSEASSARSQSHDRQGYARSHQPRSFNTNGISVYTSHAPSVGSSNWLSGNVSSAGSHVWHRELPRDTGRRHEAVPTPAQQRSASTGCAVSCCRCDSPAPKARSRSAPPENPFVPTRRGPPWPQPLFRPAGPGPKFVRNPRARTITFRPVHMTLGFDARREARVVRSPPWAALPYPTPQQRRYGVMLSENDSDSSDSCCGGCGCFGR